jgi:prepilin-type N-terminal cleavage/methylation domain-containing protein/prepilin-type processing-associated H-X9-DG protein
LQPSAFTLVELIVVIGIIAVLAALLLPAHTKTKEKGQALRCLGNNKQLNLALAMYAADNQESLPPNGDDDLDGTYWFPGNEQITIDAFNPTQITNRANLLGRYVGATDSSVYRCPGDTRQGILPGGGAPVPLVRSFSLNLAVGTSAGSDFYPNGVPVYASGLIGVSQIQPGQQPFNTFGKLTDNYAPGPANVFTFMDEDQYSVNFGSFLVTMFSTGSSVAGMNKPTQMMDWPCSAHGGVASVSFLDGHAELHKWLDGRTQNVQHKNGTLLGYAGSGSNSQPTPMTPDNPDILWLQSKTTAPK